MNKLRLNMKRKFMMGFTFVLLAVVVVWGLYIAFRVAQFVSQELDPMWRMEQEQGFAQKGVGDLSKHLWSVRRNTAEGFGESFPADIDQDGDGLGALNEILNLTSDQSVDSDNDGIPDPEDQCTNCRAISYRDRIESILASELICSWGSAKERNYVVSTHSVNPIPECPDTMFVVAPRWAVHFLTLQPEAIGNHRNPDFGLLKIEPRVYVPGLVYGYYVDYYCGSLCAEWSYAFIVDIPLIGPVYTGRRVLGVS